MKLIEFPEQTVIIAKDQPQYLPMPAHVTHDDMGRVICCWKLSWRERLRLLFTGKLWHHICAFGNPIQPQLLEVKSPFIVAAKAALLLSVALFTVNVKASDYLLTPPAENAAMPSFSQTTGITINPPVISNNTNQRTAFDTAFNAIFGGVVTNCSVDLYATYAPKAPNGNSKVGGGLFVAYNFNQYAGAGIGVDWLGQFSLVSGNVQFQAPMHLTTIVPLFKSVSWAQNVIISPFTIAGIGTPYSGNGQFNGSAMVISDIGAYVAFGHLWGGQFNTGLAWGKWIGQGAYGGVTRYHAFFGYMKSF